MEVDEILSERGKTHGPFEVQASVARGLKAIAREHSACLSEPQQEALDMILHKVSRILCGNPDCKDHWDDIAGYARLVSRELEKPKMGFVKTRAEDCGP